MLANHPNAAPLMNSSLERIYGEGDRIMLGVAWGLLLLSLALAPWYGTWALALTVGITLAAASTAAVFLLPARRGAAYSMQSSSCPFPRCSFIRPMA
jgi:4-hydroxybenzoate polyprenyltransferase